MPTTYGYNVHRWYEPQTGRYTRSDPQGLQAGPHLYGYALANPLRYVDPLGLIAWSCTNIEFSVGKGIMGGLFFIDCESECVNGKRARGSYGAGGGGVGLTIGIEISGWNLEDGTSTPDPKNLEGPFGIGNCSATPVVGVSASTVRQGMGTGTWSPGPSFGFGAGCFALAGGVKLFDGGEECCEEP